MREPFLQIDVQRVVERVAIRGLRVDRSERRNYSRTSQRAGQLCVQHGLSNQASAGGLGQEIIRRVRPEEIRDGRRNNSAASRRQHDHAGNDVYQRIARQQRIREGRTRRNICREETRWSGTSPADEQRFSRAGRITVRVTRKVRDLQFCARCVDIERMGQVMRAYKQIAAGDRHVLGQLPFYSEVRLVGVRVFEILVYGHREGQHRSESRKCLIVETLAAKLIL